MPLPHLLLRGGVVARREGALQLLLQRCILLRARYAVSWLWAFIVYDGGGW